MENQEKLKGKLLRQRHNSRPEVRFGWILIAIGFMAGGFLGIFQTPPLTAGEGWVISRSYTSEGDSIIIPDQNGDGINDIFVWHSARLYDSSYGGETEWNLTAGATILDGNSGNIILQKKYTDQSSLSLAWSEYPLIRTEHNEILLVVGKILNLSSFEKNGEVNNEIAELYLTKISLKNLTILAMENLVDNKWESIQQVKNSTQVVAKFYYLPNMGFKAPNSSYEGDLLMYENNYQYLNDDGNGFNYSKICFSFINPSTLETISQINYTKNGNEKITLCQLPQKDTQMGWYSPYFGSIFQQDYPEKGYFSMTSMDKINSSRVDTQWLFPAIAYYTSEISSYYMNMWDEIEMILLANATGNFTSVLLTQSYYTSLKQSDEFSKVSGQYFSYQNSANDFQSIIGSRVTCFNFQNPNSSFVCFQESAKIESYLHDLQGINKTNPKGIPIKTIVTQETNAMNGEGYGPNSIAIVWSNYHFEFLNISNICYPYLKYTITYITQQAAGTNGTTQITFDCLNGTEYQINDVNGTFVPYYLKVHSITNFDIDHDNRTDIALPGTTIETSQIAMKYEEEKKPINGPYFAITREKSHQATFLPVFYLSRLWCAQDLNNDSISDVGFRGIAVLFTQLDAPVKLSWWDSKVQDPSTKAILFLGIGFTVAGLLILILTLSLLASEGEVKFIKRPGFILLILLAAILVSLLYTRLISLQNAISNDYVEVKLGASAETQAVSNLTRISAWASFVYVTLLPMTLGLYVLLTPSMAEKAVILNEISYAKKAAYQAVKSHSIVQNTEKLANVEYKVMILPPFGKKIGYGGLFSRIISIVALAISIGLYCFKYIGNYFFHTETFESFASISDPNFSLYLQALFLTLIIPGIIAIPVFVWLIPSSWLLDDAGVLFYVKSTKLRKPEDVESIALWFSSALKGFLGISAIANYLEFILKSPILNSPGIIDNTNIVDETLFFVFGFLVVVALSMGILAVIIYEITMPYSANRLYRRLDARQIDTIYKSLEFKNIDKLSPELVINGYLNVPKNPKKNKGQIKEELEQTKELKIESNVESTIINKTEQPGSTNFDSKPSSMIESDSTNMKGPKFSQKIEQKSGQNIETKSEIKPDPKKDSKKPMK